MGCYNALQYQALHTSSPLNVTLMVASMPVWMMAVGALFFGVRPQRREMLGAALSTAGVLLVIARGDWRVLAELHFVPGDGYMVIALFVWPWLVVAGPTPAAMQGAQRPVWTWAEALMAQLIFGASFALGMAGIEQVAAPAAILWSLGTRGRAGVCCRRAVAHRLPVLECRRGRGRSRTGRAGQQPDAGLCRCAVGRLVGPGT